MKKVSVLSVFLTLPLIFFPYLLIVAHASIFLSTKVSFIEYFYEKVLKNNGLLMLPILLVLLLLVAFCLTLFTLICAKRRVSAHSVTKTMLWVKIAMLPGYILNLLAALVMFITIFTIPFSFIIAFFDGLLLIVSFIPMIYALVTAAKQKQLRIAEALTYAVLQFVPLAEWISDGVFCGVLKKRSRKASASQSTEVSEPVAVPEPETAPEPAPELDLDAEAVPTPAQTEE